MSNLKWSVERPVVSGNYWLSVHPDKRGSEWDAVEFVSVTVYRTRTWVRVEPPGTVCDNPEDIEACIFDGAQWALRELPADPFHKPSSSTHGLR